MSENHGRVVEFRDSGTTRLARVIGEGKKGLHVVDQNGRRQTISQTHVVVSHGEFPQARSFEELVSQLEANMCRVVLGKPEVVRLCTVALLAGEHILLNSRVKRVERNQIELDDGRQFDAGDLPASFCHLMQELPRCTADLQQSTRRDCRHGVVSESNHSACGIAQDRHHP